MQLVVSIVYALGCVLLIALLFFIQEEDSGASSFTTSVIHNLGAGVKTTSMAQRAIALLFIALTAMNIFSKRIVLRNKTQWYDNPVITAQDLMAVKKVDEHDAEPAPPASPPAPQETLIKKAKRI